MDELMEALIRDLEQSLEIIKHAHEGVFESGHSRPGSGPGNDADLIRGKGGISDPTGEIVTGQSAYRSVYKSALKNVDSAARNARVAAGELAKSAGVLNNREVQRRGILAALPKAAA